MDVPFRCISSNYTFSFILELPDILPKILDCSQAENTMLLEDIVEGTNYSKDTVFEGRWTWDQTPGSPDASAI